jgi:hypothetical protein
MKKCNLNLIKEWLGSYLCFAVSPLWSQISEEYAVPASLLQEKHSSMKACRDEALFTVIIWTRGPGQMVTAIVESIP